MSWLDTLRDRGLQAKRAAEPAAPEALQVAQPTPTPKREIQSAWVQIAAARLPEYPGAVEAVFYFVEHGAVHLCNETGKPAGPNLALKPKDNPREVAGMLFLSKWNSAPANARFNQPMHYRTPQAIV